MLSVKSYFPNTKDNKLPVLAEDLGSVLSTHREAYRYSKLQFQRSNALWPLWHSMHVVYTHIMHAVKRPIIINNKSLTKNKSFLKQIPYSN